MSVTDLLQQANGTLMTTSRLFQERSYELLHGLNCHVVANDLPANLVQITRFDEEQPPHASYEDYPYLSGDAWSDQISAHTFHANFRRLFETGTSHTRPPPHRIHPSPVSLIVHINMYST